MLEINLNVAKRTPSNKGALNQMRKNGNVPGVFYLKGDEPVPFTVLEKELKPLVYTAETRIVNLKIDENDPKRAILKDIQFDPVTDRIIHIDLLGLTAGQVLSLQVPILLEGTAAGIKEGGVLQQLLHKVDVECLPKNIPQHISVNITNLKVGESIHIKDLQLEDIKILTSEDVTIVSVVQPKVVAAEITEELGDEDKTQPEVIGKGKTNEDEE